jgi:NADH dehydrogenase FAD-containing subunit
MTQPATIAVLGGGYAGLFAAHRAARAAAKTRHSPVRVALVDAEDSWEERTRWHQLATGQKIRAWRRDRILAGTGVVLVRGTVTGIDHLKEAIEHYVALAVRAERRIPGLYHWRPAPRQ